MNIWPSRGLCEKWMVRLGKPVQGKYANGNVRLSAIRLAPVNRR